MSEQTPLTIDQLPPDHVPPEVSPGVRVRFWPTPAMIAAEELAGFVMKVDGNNCDILVYNEGNPLFREFCCHREDWQLILRPARFEDNQSGVWELADSEIQIRENAVKLAKLELDMYNLEQRFRAQPAAVSRPVKNDDPNEVVPDDGLALPPIMKLKQKRGRPKSVPQPTS
jgi:hypothetical protein